MALSEMSDLADEARYGGSHTANKPDGNAEMERMMQENWLLTNDEMTGGSNISHDSKHHIIHEVLKY